MSGFDVGFDGGPPASSGGGGGVAPVDPSIVNNFVSFSSVTGDQQDSGFKAADFVVLSPALSARNVIQPTLSTVVPLTTKGVAGQSVDLQQWQISSGVVVGRIGKTGQQIIQTSNDIVSLIVKGNSAGLGQSADLQQWQSDTGVVVARISGQGQASFFSDLTLTNADIITDTVFGSRYGTTPTQKIGFWGATPDVQNSGASQQVLDNQIALSYTSIVGDVTTAGLADPAKVNQDLFNICTLLNAIRDALTNSGLIKGSA